MASVPTPSPEEFALPSEPAQPPLPPILPPLEAGESVPAGVTIEVNTATDGSDSEMSSDAQPVIAPPTDDWLGKTIAGYEIIAKLGQGGMGVVYKGRQVSLDRTVAIKVLSKALSDNQEFIKRFEREAKSIARLNHPNIVKLYDSGQLPDGNLYTVLEYIEGVPLDRLLKQRGALPAREALRLMDEQDRLRAVKLEQLRDDVRQGLASGAAQPWSAAEAKSQARPRRSKKAA